jgi:hypothetical protein
MAASVARARRAIGLSIISPSAMDQTRKQAKLEFAGVPPKPRRWARTPCGVSKLDRALDQRFLAGP